MQEIKIKTKDLELEGILIKEDKDYYSIKLVSGYNVNILKSKVIKITKGKKLITPTTKGKSMKGTYSLLHTGGTIASKVDYSTGSVVAQYNPEDIIKSIPELKKMGSFSSILVSNIMSECITFKHYNKIAKAVEKEVNRGSKGIIVTHGTDFLHSTAAALSFMLEGITIPVVFTGSQRSSDRGSTDAPINVICAAHFLKEKKAGVFVCMHGGSSDDSCIIIDGVHARKMHTSRRDAFQSINQLPLANVHYPTGKIDYFREATTVEGKFSVKLMKDVKVGIIKTRPNMYAKEFDFFSSYHGLIIEGSGIGNAPVIGFDIESNESEKINLSIRKLCKKIPVALTSQTIHGRINMDVYSVSRRLKDAGVLGNQLDMITEVAYVKLAWLISNYPDKIKELYNKNLRGEITEYSKQQVY